MERGTNFKKLTLTGERMEKRREKSRGWGRMGRCAKLTKADIGGK